MVKVISCGHQEIITKANTKMMREMVMEKCIGQMVHVIKANGFEEINMVKVK
jgi:hypothetical protein